MTDRQTMLHFKISSPNSSFSEVESAISMISDALEAVQEQIKSK